jgi:hypothetical protein
MTASTQPDTKWKKLPKVSEYITRQVALCGKPQTQIASEAGFDKPNIITMFKTGATKLPIPRVAVLAKALGVDPIFLLRLAMSEYQPDNWAAIESILTQPVLTENELEIIQLVRSANVQNPKLRNDEDKQMLLDAINNLKGDNEIAD